MKQERTVTPDASGRSHAALIDWGRLVRRLGLVAVTWLALSVVGALVTGMALGDPAPGLWIGIGAVGLTASTVALVAGAAVGGMLRAGERGERLAGQDVGLSPPQTRRRSWRRSGRS